jgi:DnaK suppressor protein
MRLENQVATLKAQLQAEVLPTGKVARQASPEPRQQPANAGAGGELRLRKVIPRRGQCTRDEGTVAFRPAAVDTIILHAGHRADADQEELLEPQRQGLPEGDVRQIGMAVRCMTLSCSLATRPRGDARDLVQHFHQHPHPRVNGGIYTHELQAMLGAIGCARGADFTCEAIFTGAQGGGRKQRSWRHAVNRRQLRPFYRLLMARRQELLSEAERTLGGMTKSKENFPDPTDRASLESDRNAMLRIRDRERKLIAKIDDALKRISDGSYGLCEECGGPIGLERLKARPVTTLCIGCKSDQEAQERRQRV